MPIDIRRQFDFSPEKYIQEYGTENWMRTIGYIQEKPLENKTTEVKVNEQGN